MNKYINKFKQNEKKLRTPDYAIPKEYWRYMHSLKDPDRGERPSLSSLYEYFRMLAITPHMNRVIKQ